MSNPPNILSDFRTYSYHQFLIVADGMNAAIELSNQDEIVLFNRATGSPDNSRTRYLPRYLGPGNTLGYVVLVDGMRDTTFNIQSANWETITAPQRNTGGLQFADTIEVDGKMTIVEPNGVRFLEVLNNASRDLGTSPSGLIFILKTVFKGHTSTGTTKLISNVRPFMFTMTDVNAVFDAAGATYIIEMVGINNGTAKLPQISRIADGVNVLVNNDTVFSALKKLEVEINRRYAKFKDDLKVQIDGGTAAGNIDLDNDFREVKYIITPDPEYANTSYIAGDNISVNETAGVGTAQIASGANSTIESAIAQIMRSSSQVMADAAKKNPENKEFLYKITNTLPADLVDDKYVVEFVVHRYEAPSQQVGQPLNPSLGEFIEFDYMFTGRNVDVIEFDIKMDMGLSFFFTLATSDNIPSEQSGVIDRTKAKPAKGPNVDPSGTGVSEATSEGADIKRRRSPLFLGTTLKDPLMRNKSNPLDTATFSALLSRHAAYEHIEASIKIAGNPQLLDEFLPTPAEVSSGATETTKEGTTGSQAFMKTPALIRVNVQFPTSNDLRSFDKFWYQGFYTIYSITQNFDKGLFTQDITMFSLPQTDGTGEALSTSVPVDSSIDNPTPVSNTNAEEQSPTGNAK